MDFSLATVFGAGLLTFLTPCVLPIVPIYLTALVGGDPSALEGKRRGLLMTRAGLFALGFTSVFTLMGLGASSIGVFLGEHRAAVQLAGALIVLVLGLKFVGLVDIPILDRVAKADDQKLSTRFGGVNALLMGVVFAAGWSPCVGPVLGSVLTLTAAKSASPLVGAGYLAVYGLGFALPLIAAAAFAEAALKLIGRISPHLPRIERAIGILLIGVAGYLALGAYEDNAPEETTSRGGALSSLVAESPGGEPMPTMVELYADGCTVCEKMKPVVDGLTAQCDQRGVRVHAVNVSDRENRHLVDALGVVGVPTFVFIDELGAEAARLVGEQSERALKQGLSALRGTPCPGLALLDKSNNLPRSVIEFPTDDEDEEVLACPSTNTGVRVAEKSSRRSAAQTTQMTSSVPSASSPQESCSQVLQ